ncbi:hypothetical protein L6452_21871 [Arctium lappa]|uniref:Uncharacterized protein n=1 Tax=Arctium lappa TaxID=4217 RepID=A0ACB9AZ32_ARCLA|nr:hypothetical protein L6452_21871 [Arctium lappa]
MRRTDPFYSTHTVNTIRFLFFFFHVSQTRTILRVQPWKIFSTYYSMAPKISAKHLTSDLGSSVDLGARIRYV